MLRSIEGIGCKMQLASLNLWWTNQFIPKIPKLIQSGPVLAKTVANGRTTLLKYDVELKIITALLCCGLFFLHSAGTESI